MADKSGKPCLAVKFNIAIQSHSEFMQGVNEDVAQLAKVNGIDAAQKATALVPKIGQALEKLVPVLDKFASVSPSISRDEALTDDFSIGAPDNECGLDGTLFCD